MKIRFISIITLISSIFFSTAVNAEWLKISEGSAVNLYIDAEKIKTSGKSVRVWALYDLKNPTKNYKSIILLKDVDCKAEKHRALQSSFYSGHMASGVVVNTIDTPDEWTYVTPGSVSYTLMDIVCITTK